MDARLRSRLGLPLDQVGAFCRRWRIEAFALFGSILRDDFNESSDVDVLVRWSPSAEWSVLDHLRMERELGELLGRRVEIVSWRALDERATPAARAEIVGTAAWLDVA